MSYWIFKANPSKYRLDDRLKDPQRVISWTVSRYRDQIKPGDIVFLWRAAEPRGIVATLKVLSPPVSMLEFVHEQKYWDGEDNDLLVRVVAEITQVFPTLSNLRLKNTPGLEDLSAFTGFQQATNFPVRDAEGEIILSLLRARSSVMEAL